MSKMGISLHTMLRLWKDGDLDKEDSKDETVSAATRGNGKEEEKGSIDLLKRLPYMGLI